ncbi:TPA: hypothetical protein EYP13_03065 [Candidatus Micrarchaeota archaeon]|nr:hypothetical protein [Candidatus Micrarchaeota archaeon]
MFPYRVLADVSFPTLDHTVEMPHLLNLTVLRGVLYTKTVHKTRILLQCFGKGQGYFHNSTHVNAGKIAGTVHQVITARRRSVQEHLHTVGNLRVAEERVRRTVQQRTVVFQD